MEGIKEIKSMTDHDSQQQLQLGSAETGKLIQNAENIAVSQPPGEVDMMSSLHPVADVSSQLASHGNDKMSIWRREKLGLNQRAKVTDKTKNGEGEKPALHDIDESVPKRKSKHQISRVVAERQGKGKEPVQQVIENDGQNLGSLVSMYEDLKREKTRRLVLKSSKLASKLKEQISSANHSKLIDKTKNGEGEKPFLHDIDESVPKRKSKKLAGRKLRKSMHQISRVIAERQGKGKEPAQQVLQNDGQDLGSLVTMYEDLKREKTRQLVLKSANLASKLKEQKSSANPSI